MFKKIASEAFGFSDIGKIIGKNDYDKVDSDDYIFHEINEKIFFLIKSKKDEYCFTNRALIHVDGESAISSKRVLKRYEYKHHNFSSVLLETAGKVDLDVEIKFNLGDESFSIDVDKNQIDELKDLYKALFEISHIQLCNKSSLINTKTSLDMATSAIGKISSDSSPSIEFNSIAKNAFSILEEAKEKYVVEDFTSIFSKFINN